MAIVAWHGGCKTNACLPMYAILVHVMQQQSCLPVLPAVHARSNDIMYCYI